MASPPATRRRGDLARHDLFHSGGADGRAFRRGRARVGRRRPRARAPLHGLPRGAGRPRLGPVRADAGALPRVVRAPALGRRLRGLGGPGAGARGGAPAGAGVHDPARLRAQLVLRLAPGEHLGRARAQRADADAVRGLAPRALAPPFERGRPRPPGHRRRGHAHRARVPRAQAAPAPGLPHLPSSADPARAGPAALLRAVPALALRPGAARARDLAQRDGSQRGARRALRGADARAGGMAHGDRAERGRGGGGLGRLVAVLRPAPVRAHLLGRAGVLGSPRRLRSRARPTTCCRAG